MFLENMLAVITWNIRPEVFPGFEYLRWYGLCWGLGLFLGYYVMQYIYLREGKSLKDLDNLAVYIVFGAIIGARLGHVFFYEPDYFLQHPIEILPIRLEPSFHFTGLAGLASHGGIFGAMIALYLYNRNHKMGYVHILDRLMVAGPLLGGFIRLGNLMNSEIIGVPTSVPWAFIFTNVDSVPRHPAQLYEALFYFLIFGILFYLWRKKNLQRFPGFLFGLGITLIFVQRFLVEFLKEDQVDFEASLWLNMGQLLSIPLILAGIVMMYFSLQKTPKTPQSTDK